MATNQDKLGTIVTEAPDRTVNQILKPEETVTGDSGEVKITLGLAYRTYLEGRRNLAQAFKVRGQQDQEAYRDAEQRYRLCEEAIENAMKVRERAEKNASDAYKEDVDKAVDNASRAYKDKTKQVLTECKQRVMEAWRSSTETSKPMTSVCEEAIEKAMKAREKAELDALDAYREDVNKAVDKASRGYKDKMKQALTECMQRVMNAWINSMDTSAQMTSVFEEDRNLREDEQYPERKSGHQKLQIRETILHMKKSFMSISQRALKELKLRRNT
jgi:hypothetical protein